MVYCAQRISLDYELNARVDAMSERTVILAKAGIQLKMMCAARDLEALCASHDIFELDSGLRRNDEC